jgi:hypothetical protein
MAEDFQKVKPIEHNFGNGNYFRIVPTANGYHCNCNIAGEHVQFEDKDLKAIEVKMADSLTNLNKDYKKRAKIFNEVALLMNKGILERLVQKDDDHKTDLGWVKE